MLEDIRIESIRFDANQKLKDLITDKVIQLRKIYNRIESCSVILKNEKNSQTKNCVIEMTMVVYGKKLFSKEAEDNFELATNLAVDDLKKQLKKYKLKLNQSHSNYKELIE